MKRIKSEELSEYGKKEFPAPYENQSARSISVYDNRREKVKGTKTFLGKRAIKNIKPSKEKMWYDRYMTNKDVIVVTQLPPAVTIRNAKEFISRIPQ